jgi:glyoxylase-like metal-dependent hydrolase (beta-lactamase superfamily II)
MGDLAREGFRTEVREVEPDLLGIGVQPGIGVGQRGLVVRTPAGNLLWDPPAFLDAAAIDAVREAGGLHAVSSSHPHMYGAAVEWSHAFGAEIRLADLDAGWLTRLDPAARTWSGSLEVLPGVTLIQCGGHFPGSAVILWSAGAGGRGALLVGDTLFVTPGEDRVSFIWSAPNRLPLPEGEVRRIVEALAPYEFDRMYGGWWDPIIRGDAKAITERSATRYIGILHGAI